MKKLVSILFVMQAVFAFAQTKSGVTGKVVDSKTQKPLQNVVTTIQNTNFTQMTDVTGRFTFDDLDAGTKLLLIKSSGYKDQLLPVIVEMGKIIDLGVVVMDEDITAEQQLSLITITENDLGDDNSGSESTSGLLQASRDAFQQAAAFNWGQARFRVRGLDNEYGTTMINGVIMNKIYDGRPQWSNWGGLNDATRNQEFTTGVLPSDYTFGGILGTQEINTRASIYRPGNRISFSGTNTNYSWRAMATHASGIDKNGWSYVVSGSRRWSNDGYFEGTDYAANSLFGSIEKKFNEHHSLGVTAIYAQNRRGKNSPNTDEVTHYAGIKYNSYWGYQNGEVRNSRDKTVDEPITMLTHYWKITDKSNLNTSVAYQTGRIGNTRLAYQNADNPDPTYYRKLPSYYTSFYDATGAYTGNSAANLNAADSVLTNFRDNHQINWQAMIDANHATANGRSAYVLYEDRTDDRTWTANSVFSSQISDNILMNAGATYRRLKSHNFENLLDLLGGEFFEDFDNYSSGQQQINDLNHPLQQVVEGGTFGYNYNLYANVVDAFTQFRFTYKKFDFYLGESFSRSEYQREGLYRNGKYPNNSFGKSGKSDFEDFGFKGGVTYKITGNYLLSLNAAHMTKAPSLRDAYPNARLNDNVSPDLQSQTVSSVDASFIIRTPKFKSRLTGFYSKIDKATETSFFFGEGIFDDTGDGSDAFVAETVSDISKRYMGVELGMEYAITTTIKVTASGNYGRYVYANNPNVSVNNDALATETNFFPVTDFGPAAMKNYRISGTPQSAASVGVEYRDPHFWWIGVNGNYLADNYIDVSALLRTENFFSNPEDPFGLPFGNINDDQARRLLKQEKLDDFFLMNLTGGKSWKIGKETFGFFASINNVLDQVYKTGGFEQSRKANYLEVSQDQLNPGGVPAFGPKYFYGFGRTYFVNLYIQF